MSILDRYILRSLVLSILFALLALSLIFIIVNLIESLDRFIDQQADVKTIAMYYVYYLPEIIKLLLPVTLLVATLFTIGKLTMNYETTAMKSAGMSLYRLMAPLMVLGFVISFAHLYFNSTIVPRALSKKFAIERQYLGRSVGGIQQQLYNLYLRDTPLRTVTIGYYDLTTQQGTDFVMEEYSSPSHPQTQRRIEAARFQWDSLSHSWIAFECFVRSFDNGVPIINYTPNMHIELMTRHTELSVMQRSFEEMTYSEQADYIDFLRRGGRSTRQLDIVHTGDYAFPFANVIVILLAVPFASVRKRSGLAASIAAAMTTTFLYLVLTKVSQAFGMGTSLSPAVIGWSANAIFVVVALINLFRTPT